MATVRQRMTAQSLDAELYLDSLTLSEVSPDAYQSPLKIPKMLLWKVTYLTFVQYFCPRSKYGRILQCLFCWWNFTYWFSYYFVIMDNQMPNTDFWGVFYTVSFRAFGFPFAFITSIEECYLAICDLVKK
jgi:hypothetical protein